MPLLLMELAVQNYSIGGVLFHFPGHFEGVD
jgi:hypothetical protein